MGREMSCYCLAICCPIWVLCLVEHAASLYSLFVLSVDCGLQYFLCYLRHVVTIYVVVFVLSIQSNIAVCISFSICQ